jgi:hypothetical protein
MALSDLAPSFEPSLTEHGFALTATQSGFGSGGPYEVGVWTRGDRRFSISLRYDSLAVGYRIGDIGMDHAAYMRALLGPAGPNLFPSYSHDAAAASVALGHDLRHHCDDFFGRGRLRVSATRRRRSRGAGDDRVSTSPPHRTQAPPGLVRSERSVDGSRHYRSRRVGQEVGPDERCAEDEADR